VARLTKADTEGVLRFVAEAESLGGNEPFTADLLVELGELVEADWVTYCELDRVRKRILLNVQRQGDTSEPDDDDVFWTVVVDEHPVCVRHQQGYVGALKVSDFLSRRELHATRLYDLWFRPVDIEHELNVAIPSPLWHTKTFLFDRQGRRDFTERDRLVLEALLPHLTRLWQAARTRRLLAAALTELETASPADSRGVILLAAGGGVEFATPPARRLVGEFFPDRLGARLPDALDTWLEAGAAAPLVRCRDGRRLTVERSGDTLLVEARQAEALLTPREREVLSWVARGKTNAEIARLLWLSPSTVGKHLENVYGKLGVSTRTAAVARFLGLIDAEASQLG
jgi:DNA-binding CsgD family transcriptional regulator